MKNDLEIIKNILTKKRDDDKLDLEDFGLTEEILESIDEYDEENLGYFEDE